MKPLLAHRIGILVTILGFFQAECRTSSPWSVWHKYSDRNRIYSPPVSHQRTAPRSSSSNSSSSTLENGRWVIRGGRHVWMPYKWSAPPPPPSNSNPATDRKQGKYPQSTYFVYRVDRLSPLQALVSKVKAKLSPLQSIVRSVKSERGQSGKNAIETKNSFRAKFVGDWDIKQRNKLSHKRTKPGTRTSRRKGSQTSITKQKGSEIKWQVNVGKGSADKRKQVARTENKTARRNGRRFNNPRNDKSQQKKILRPTLLKGKRIMSPRPSKKMMSVSSPSFSRGGVTVSKGKGVEARRTWSSKNIAWRPRPSIKISRRPKPSNKIARRPGPDNKTNRRPNSRNKIARRPGPSNVKAWRSGSSDTKSRRGSSSDNSGSDSDEEDD